jgi:hypothetical protein
MNRILLIAVSGLALTIGVPVLHANAQSSSSKNSSAPSDTSATPNRSTTGGQGTSQPGSPPPSSSEYNKNTTGGGGPPGSKVSPVPAPDASTEQGQQKGNAAIEEKGKGSGSSMPLRTNRRE